MQVAFGNFFIDFSFFQWYDMEKKKVKNVIKGFMSKWDIEELTIIEDEKEKVTFSGDIEKFLYPSELMRLEADRIKNAEVKRILEFNGRKLFIFI